MSSNNPFVKRTDEISIDQFAQKVKELDTRMDRYLPSKSSIEFEVIEATEEKDQYRISFKGRDFDLSDYGLNQFLAKIGVPITYFPRSSVNLRKMMVKEGLENSQLLTFQTFDDTIIGVQGSKGRPLSYVDTVDALQTAIYAEQKKRGGGEEMIQLATAELDPYNMQLRAVLPATDRVLGDKNDHYQYGFHIQLSEVKASEVIVAPMLYRLICSNGLIDVRSQNKMVKQSSISIAKDALSIVFEDMFEWIAQDGSKGMFATLNDLLTNGTQYTFMQVKRMLESVTKKIRSDIGAVFVEEVMKELPPGLATSTKVKVNAYDFVQILTNKAQRLPFASQTAIEKNVAGLLLP